MVSPSRAGLNENVPIEATTTELSAQRSRRVVTRASAHPRKKR